MRTIYGKDVGNTIDVRAQGPYTMRHPWKPQTAERAYLERFAELTEGDPT